MTTKIPETLAAKVESLVREHLAEQQVAAKAALERAFAASTTQRTTIRRRASYRRRATTEVADLAEQLFEAVKACPGETMTFLAARVGGKPRGLHRPMMRLKDAGRVHSAGERNFTRYFPMVATRSA